MAGQLNNGCSFEPRDNSVRRGMNSEHDSCRWVSLVQANVFNMKTSLEVMEVLQSVFHAAKSRVFTAVTKCGAYRAYPHGYFHASDEALRLAEFGLHLECMCGQLHQAGVRVGPL